LENIEVNMKTLVVIPVDWQCTIADCPPGLFVRGDQMGFVSEYTDESGNREVFVAESGEYFWGGAGTMEERDQLLVIPCSWEWQDLDR
jgi:hypothetical protein